MTSGATCSGAHTHGSVARNPEIVRACRRRKTNCDAYLSLPVVGSGRRRKHPQGGASGERWS